MLVDTHCHLAFPQFADELEDLVGRAEAAAVSRIVTIGTDLDDSRRNLEIAGRFAGVFATVGIHPTSVLDPLPDDWLDQLDELARHPKVAAIGEIGLDFHHPPQGGVSEEDYHARQHAVFSAQLGLAERLGLGVVIHQRDSFAATAEVLSAWHGRVRCVLHCYTGSWADARPLVERGHLISFTGIATFRNATTVRECAAAAAAGSFMLETDAPFLAPVPHRGKRCEPAFTRHTAEQIAALRGIGLDELAAETTRTAEGFFRIDGGSD